MLKVHYVPFLFLQWLNFSSLGILKTFGGTGVALTTLVSICSILAKPTTTIEISTSWLPFIPLLGCQLEEALKQWELLLLSLSASGFLLGCLLVLDMLVTNYICHQYLWVFSKYQFGWVTDSDLVLVLDRVKPDMEVIRWISVDVDFVVRLLSTLHSTLSVAERKHCLPPVQVVYLVLPVDILLSQWSFGSSESIGNATVRALITSNPKPH